MDPTRLVDEVLEGLAEVQLAQDRADARVVEVRLEVVELERVPVDEPVALRPQRPPTAGRSLSGTYPTEIWSLESEVPGPPTPAGRRTENSAAALGVGELYELAR